MNTVKLFRPVGLKEAQIAEEWNTGDAFSGYCGVVTEFDVVEDHYRRYEVQHVGGAIHEELWVPAEELEEFNNNIVGHIRIVEAFFGEGFELPVNEELAEELKKYKK